MKASSIRLRSNGLLPFFLILLAATFFFLTLQSSVKTIGQPFPGYLSFKNKVVGPFHLPSWSGQHEGFSYPKMAPMEKLSRDTFSRRDFILVVLVPATTGLLLIMLGVGIFFYMTPRAGLLPLLFFHFLVGALFILLPEVQLSGRFSYLALLCFALIPPTMLHFTFLISEMLFEVRKRFVFIAVAYLASALILIPYLYSFQFQPGLWIKINALLLVFLILVYFFWLIRLISIFFKPHLDVDRVISRYLLLGQVIGIVLASSTFVALSLAAISLPLNLASPMILIFPISLLIGIVPGRRQQMETYLVQVEKRATFGNLLSGLAHELNNPMTFIYSNIEPLRESLQFLGSQIRNPDEKTSKVLRNAAKMIDNMEEGVTRSRALIEKFRDFPKNKKEEKEDLDLNQILERSIDLLGHKWKDRIEIVRKLEPLPKMRGYAGELGQVFTNLLANACDATPAGGKIQVSTHQVSGGIKISIRDKGKGIPKEEIGKIFDPFFTTKAQGEGTGLGLAITLQLVKNHRGSVEVKSEANKGTEFIVFLPLQ